MQISTIRNNYYNTLNKKVNSPNFKSLLSPKHTQRVLNMLRPAVTETVFGKDMSSLRMTFDRLSRKYLPHGIQSYGVMVIPDKHLKKFCANKIPPKKLSSMQGYCVAAGGKYSPMQIWTEVYETNVVLVPKNKIYTI